MPHALDSFEELLEHPEYRVQDLKDAYKCIINAVGGFDTFRTYEYNGGKIIIDDELIQENGIFIPKKLRVLNKRK